MEPKAFAAAATPVQGRIISSIGRDDMYQMAMCKRMKLKPYLHHKLRKKHVKEIRLEKIRHETIKLLDENVGGKLLDIDFGEDSLFWI